MRSNSEAVPPGARPSHAAYLARGHFGSLDGIRAISIIAVIWHHAWTGSPGVPLLGHGFLGVDMFFVMSGFLIVTLLLRERRQAGRISLRAFYARRMLRIFPLYYAMLAGIALLYTLRGIDRPGAAQYLSALPYYLTYTSNWIAVHAAGLAFTWSLAAEEQFYLVWPACEKFLNRRRLYVALGGVVVVSEFVSFGLLDGVLGHIGLDRGRLSILQATFTPIALGVCAAHALHSPAGFERARSLLGARGAPVLLGGLTLLACSWPGDLAGLPRLVIHALMACFLVSCVVREDHALAPVLRCLPMRRIGIVSYGMYLFHLYITVALAAVAASFAIDLGNWVFLPALAATYVAAEASFWSLERHVLRLKARFGRIPRSRDVELAFPDMDLGRAAPMPIQNR